MACMISQRVCICVMPRPSQNTGRCWKVNRFSKQQTANRKQGRENSKYETPSSPEGAIKFSLAACKHSAMARTVSLRTWLQTCRKSRVKDPHLASAGRSGARRAKRLNCFPWLSRISSRARPTLCWRLQARMPLAPLREPPLALLQQARHDPPMQASQREQKPHRHSRRASRRHSRPCTSRRP